MASFEKNYPLHKERKELLGTISDRFPAAEVFDWLKLFSITKPFPSYRLEAKSDFRFDSFNIEDDG